MITHRVITIVDYQFIDGQMQCIGTRSKSKTFKKKDPEPLTIDRYWLKDAPILYEPLEDEMIRVGILDRNDKTWLLLHKGGSAQRYLRAFYNLCFKAKCLPLMSGPELMEAYNTSFHANLTHYRGFNGSDDCDAQEQEITNRLSVFGLFFSERNNEGKQDM